MISANHIFIAPIITEKSLVAQASGKYSFWVSPTASKSQIAAAFKAVFSINPLTVNTTSIKGKVKTDWKKRLPIQKSDRKKAVITVGKDQKIDLLALKTK